MNNEYHNLHHKTLSSNTIVKYDFGSSKEKLTLSDSAFSIMTDFSRSQPYLITTNATIDDINDKMIACSVRLLFVVEGNDILQGLVTYNDIVGEKPVTYIKEHGGTRNDIQARDIMMPIDRLEALQFEDIFHARIGDIIETVKSAGRQHLLVVETQDDGSQNISGMFSSTHIEKRLGIKIELSPRPSTFADIERAVTG